MSKTQLTLRHAPRLRVDLRRITPAVCSGLNGAQIERLVVTHGNQTLALAELFSVVQADAAVDELILSGDCSRLDRIGWQMSSGAIVVDGNAGDYAGGGMSGGSLLVRGAAGSLAACEMAGGALTIEGSVGDFAASTLPGSMDGMRGGTFIVKGNAGERFADRMRRGTALVFGNTGAFAASRMVAGTLAIGGTAGAHLGFGMRRGGVVLAGAAGAGGAATDVAPTFVPAGAEAPVFWQLLARSLARHGGPFAGLPVRRITRHLGDLAADGKGELIVVG